MANREASDTNSFIQRAQSLPPELYNNVYDLTFTLSIKACHIDKFYKPPSILQINRYWRATLSPLFYDTTIFSIPGGLNGLEYMTRWLNSFTQKQSETVVSPILHILSANRITLTRRSKKENTVIHPRFLPRMERRKLFNLRYRVHMALLNVERSDNVDWRIEVEDKLKFRLQTDKGREIWWEWSMSRSIPACA